MGWVKWLVYITAFFIPFFGFVTFLVFTGRGDDLKELGKNAMVAAFCGMVVFLLLAAIGVTMFNFLFQGMMPFK